MKNKKILLTIASGSLCLAVFGVLLNNQHSIVNKTSQADNNYVLTLDSGVTVDENTHIGTVQATSGYGLDLKFNNYTYSSTKFGSFTTGGYVNNERYSEFKGIKNIEVSLDSGSVSIYTGWLDLDGEWSIEYGPSSLDVTTTSGSLDTSSYSPSYFKIEATSNTVVNYIRITYSCSESDVTTTRVKIKSPIVGGTSSISDGNNLWINTNILNKEVWSSYRMNKDSNGDYYYDFSNVSALASEDSWYSFALFISPETDSLSIWSYKFTANNIFFPVYKGQNIYFEDVTYNFESEPTVGGETYTLNLNTVCLDSVGEGFESVQFIYNYTNGTAGSSYTWKTISTTSPSYDNYSIELDNESTLYFKIYIWDNSLGDLFIGDENGNNFVLTPNGEDRHITVSFNYPTSSNTVGTMVDEDSSQSTSMSFPNQNTTVYGDTITINPTFDKDAEAFTASYSGENIRIDSNNKIVGLKAGTTTKVTLTSTSGLTCNFNVTVAASTYTATQFRDLDEYNWDWAGYRGWFTTSPAVNEISGMGQDFMHGVDISSYKALYDNGTKFYNSNGVEQSLFYIFKDAGVNWVRLKIWVDPQNGDGVTYGGGESNLTNTLWLAKEAKAAGLNLLLDFHYSDYWTHPGQQILPKAWKNASSVSELCTYIRDYTRNTLNTFKNNNCLPDMVQLGNEISSGNFLTVPGSNDSFDSYGTPNYNDYNDTKKYSFAYAGSHDHYALNSYAVSYLQAASNGVNDVDSDIEKVIHWAKSSTFTASVINTFFNSVSSVDYDYAGLSLYPYYCFPTGTRDSSYGGIDTLNTVLASLNINKPWFAAEFSYPFTGDTYVTYVVGSTYYEKTAFTVSDWTKEKSEDSKNGIENITIQRNNYPLTMAGQARMIHDFNESVVRYNGLGVFYWEPAWVPNDNVGWAASGSMNTWGNQGFFSYDGKAISNIDIFKAMSPYIN